jgi:hypothetical protein
LPDNLSDASAPMNSVDTNRAAAVAIAWRRQLCVSDTLCRPRRFKRRAHEQRKERIASRDDGKTWSAAKAVAQTSDASDHPLLLNRGQRIYLSWMTRADGYRLLALEDVP